jgi:hypothetical protein
MFGVTYSKLRPVPGIPIISHVWAAVTCTFDAAMSPDSNQFSTAQRTSGTASRHMATTFCISRVARSERRA